MAKQSRRKKNAAQRPENQRYLNYRRVHAIAEAASQLAVCIRATFPIAGKVKPILHTEGYPFGGFYKKALEHAITVERLFNPEQWGRTDERRDVYWAPGDCFDSGLGWLVASFDQVLDLYGWQPICDPSETVEELLQRLFDKEQLTVETVAQIDEVLLDALETAAAGLLNATKDLVGQDEQDAEAAHEPPPPQRLDEVRRAVEELGANATPKAIGNRVGGIRKGDLYAALRALHKEGVYTGMTPRSSKR